MAPKPITLDHVNWWSYVQRIADGATNAEIAKRIGVTAPSVGRWSTGGPDPLKAAAFARAYHRPVLEAFVAAGFLTAGEAKQRPTGRASLSELGDDELVAEVARRLGLAREGGADDAGNANAEKRVKGGAAVGESSDEFDRTSVIGGPSRVDKGLTSQPEPGI